MLLASGTDIIDTYISILLNFKSIFWFYISIGILLGVLSLDKIKDYIMLNLWDSKYIIEKFIYREHNELWFSVFIIVFFAFLWIIPVMVFFTLCFFDE